ncbi:hypothetical protein NDU88_003260 [Pleurodeles waltl]|uniref:Uncharacterized protein n=1 Tax=Pleurodeles waltl TaxID=8319 RepID=A0AAV7NG45_PLEWA|nr:hypothetical protein NDU88_003260 [Pleurodeles waltl]
MTPWTVVRGKGTLVIAQKGRESVTRNILFFKLYQSNSDTTENDLLLPPMDADGGESETSHVDTSEQDVRTHSGRCVENQGRPPGITLEGRKGDDLIETLEPGIGQERAMSTPPRGGSERYHLRPRLLPSSKLRDFLFK